MQHIKFFEGFNFNSEVVVDTTPTLGNFHSRVHFKIGDSILDIASYNQGKRYSVIELYVPIEERRQGIAEKLLIKALDYFKGVGFVAQASNSIAIHLNYKLGFRAFDEEDNELSEIDSHKQREDNHWKSIRMTSPDFNN